MQKVGSMFSVVQAACNVLEVAYKQGALAMDVLQIKFWKQF